MKTFAKTISVLALSTVLVACGGDDNGGDNSGGETVGFTEDDVRAELESFGFSGDLADCVIDEVVAQAGSMEEYAKLSSGEHGDILSAAGATCAQDASPEEIEGVATGGEGTGLNLEDPQVRESVILGMTQTGVPEDVANCVLDEAISQDISMSDLVKPDVVGPIAQGCGL